ncbi:MAG: potassium/proton antiporter [Coriobacteriia bacterium]
MASRPTRIRRTVIQGTIATLTFVGAALLLAGVLASKLTSRFGIPALLLFLVTGMLAGSEGPGGIPFDDPRVAMGIGSAALFLILFDGGLQTDLKNLSRDVAIRGALLATIGVMLTAGAVGAFAVMVLDMPLADGLLLGAILSSTDAAAVFSVLRSRSVGLSPRLRTLIEFESASNDPTAVFLTLTLIMIAIGEAPAGALIPLAFAFKLAGGGVIGWIAGGLLVRLLNRIDLEHDGLYPVLTLAASGVLFGLAEVVGTSGFIAVYIAGLTMAGRVFAHRRSLLRFHQGVAWLMQIVMFLMLGLLVFPSELLSQALPGMAISAVLMFLARPVAVMVCLAGSGFSLRERLMVSWVGLRGAAPIILATFPMVAGLGTSGTIFNTVFFAVVFSVLIQGPTAGWMARLLKVDEPIRRVERLPIEIDADAAVGMVISRLRVEAGSVADGSHLLDVGGPDMPLVILMRRQGWYFIPTGTTVLAAGDELHVLGTAEMIEAMRSYVCEAAYCDL